MTSQPKVIGKLAISVVVLSFTGIATSEVMNHAELRDVIHFDSWNMQNFADRAELEAACRAVNERLDKCQVDEGDPKRRARSAKA